MNAEKQFLELKRHARRWVDVVDSDTWETVKVYAIAAYTAQLQTTTMIDNNARIDGARAMLEVLSQLGQPTKQRSEMAKLKPV